MNRIYKIGFAFSMMALTGCSGLSIPDNNKLAEKEEVMKEYADQWRIATPAIRRVMLKKGFVIESPEDIPPEIAKKNIEVMFSKNATIDDLSSVLSPLGFFMVVSSEDIRKQPIIINEYKGTFGNFIRALAYAHDISFSWLPGNIMMIQPDKPYILQIPQNENLAEAIKDNITALGAKDASASVQAGTIQYRASERNQQRIVEMVKSMGLNASVVSMQVAIVNVTLDKERNTGFDWNSLKLGLGAQSLQAKDSSGQAVVSSGSVATKGVDASTAGTSTSSSTTAKPNGIGAFVGLNQNGLSLNMLRGDFSFMGAFRMLSTYGDAKTAQSVLMDSLSGEEVSIKSGQKIPYINSIGINTTNGNGYGNNNSLGSTSVNEVEVGLELKLKPFYDNRTETVTIGVDLSLSTLLRYMELSAGNQLGSLSRPVTQEHAFTDLIRVGTGESLIIGGLTYDSVSDNRSNLTVLEKTDTASQAKKISRTAMFIMIRPTVTVFEGGK